MIDKNLDMMTRTWGQILSGEGHVRNYLESMYFLGSPREVIEIWKDVSLRIILKGKDRNQDCLPFY